MAENPKASGQKTDKVETVTQFTQRIKAVLERGLAPGWVKGEISNLRLQSSGHVYFTLKDSGAQISAVLFRGDAARQSLKLREGQQVLAYGEISLYEPRGQYQLIVRALIEDGVGRLQQEFEALKRRLSAEGLFEAANKQPLPALPLRIGFITSPTGAAVQDFIRILLRRGWRGHCVVLPCKVQGAGAAEEMAEMLAYAQALRLGTEGNAVCEADDSGLAPYFELLVIGRGGGSIEDLWAFNEEPLVRAVAACPVPIISAVGHEIDFTLCDFAADVRAETPSGAAELISSQYLEICDRTVNAAEGLVSCVDQAMADHRKHLEPLRSRLRLLTPAALIERGFMRLDDLSNRIGSALRHAAQEKRHDLERLRALLARRSPEYRVQAESQRLLALYKRLQSASPQSVLNRGYVILRDEQGKPVMRSSETSPGQSLGAQFADGLVSLKVEP